MSKSNEIYRRRINKVINYINDNLDKSLSLNDLADLAHFSSFHFHRIFVALIGESLNSYTNRTRIEKSARLLKFSKTSISDIAYECGYSSPSTFSRSFRQYFTVTPSTFRKKGKIENSKICKELHPMAEYLCDMSLEEKKSKFPIVRKELPNRKVAYIRVADSFKDGTVIKAFEKLIKWTKDKNLFSEGQFFGMSIDDPMVTPENKYRYEACVTVPHDCIANDQDGIQLMDLPYCLYATTKITGDIRQVATAISYMYNDWLINSNYEPEHQYGLEYFLDKQNVCNWNNFDLELYIPIKPLMR
jgi:AraC family transcriptional regulator